MRRSIGLLLAITFVRCGLDEGGLATDAQTPNDASSDVTVLPDATQTDSAPIDGTFPDAGSDASAFACPTGLPGPALAPVDNAYCIDSTEVTVAEYTLFQAQMGTTIPDAGARCKYVDDLSPNGTQGDVLEPQVQVDWCDAFMYCAWANKRLCGARDGGAFTSANANDPSNAWLAACSHDGTRTYAYGSTWDAGACNDDNINSAVEPVTTFPNCVGGFPGIFDMTGNAREWIDSCVANTGNGDDCRSFGGDYTDDNNGAVCASATTHHRDYTNDATGFRCCWP